MTNADDTDDENRQLAKTLEAAQERKHEHDALLEGGEVVEIEPP